MPRGIGQLYRQARQRPTNIQSMQEKNFYSLGRHGFHRIHYTEWGEADNPNVVVCVHGLARNCRDFDFLAEALAPHCRVLCPDLPGRGQSAWLTHKEDYDYPHLLPGMAALLARATEHCGDETHISWVGTSLGGLLGMALAAQPDTPIRRLVLNDFGPFVPQAALERIGAYFGSEPVFDSFEQLEAYVRMVSATFGPLTDSQWRHLALHNSRRLGDGRYGLIYDPGIATPYHRQIGDVELWHLWDSLRCPVLVLRGTQSDLLLSATAHEMLRRGPSAQLLELPGVGHAPALMDAQQIAPIREFLLTVE
ncbi:MAG: alpha/beta hydrolase [Pseudomonadota bacterium]